MSNLIVGSSSTIIPKKSWLGVDFPGMFECPILLPCEYIAELPDVGRFVSFNRGGFKSHKKSVLGRALKIDFSDKIVINNEPVIILFIAKYKSA